MVLSQHTSYSYLAFFLLHAFLWVSKNITNQNIVRQRDKVRTEVPIYSGMNHNAGWVAKYSGGDINKLRDRAEWTTLGVVKHYIWPYIWTNRQTHWGNKNRGPSNNQHSFISGRNGPKINFIDRINSNTS